MHNSPLVLGYEVKESNLSPTLRPLLSEIVEVYKTHHPNLSAVYVLGSVALGNWKPGVSDVDVIGIVDGIADEQSIQARQDTLLRLGNNTNTITFIDNMLLTQDEIDTDIHLQGHAFKLATTGLCIWGTPVSLSRDLPSIIDVATSRVQRAEALMQKYRSGNIITAFQQNPRLLTRSAAKAAMRVLSSITILRGARFQADPHQVAKDVDIYAPEAKAIKDATMQIVNNPGITPDKAMQLTDKSIALFYSFFR